MPKPNVIQFPGTIPAPTPEPRTLNHAPVEVPAWLLEAIAARTRDLNTLLDVVGEWGNVDLTHRQTP